RKAPAHRRQGRSGGDGAVDVRAGGPEAHRAQAPAHRPAAHGGPAARPMALPGAGREVLAAQDACASLSMRVASRNAWSTFFFSACAARFSSAEARRRLRAETTASCLSVAAFNWARA